MLSISHSIDGILQHLGLCIPTKSPLFERTQKLLQTGSQPQSREYDQYHGYDHSSNGGLVAWLQVAGSFLLVFNSWQNALLDSAAMAAMLQVLTFLTGVPSMPLAYSKYITRLDPLTTNHPRTSHRSAAFNLSCFLSLASSQGLFTMLATPGLSSSRAHL